MTTSDATVNDALARAVAIAALVGMALIHMLELPDAFDAVGYLGALFVCVVAGALGLAALMTQSSDHRWWLAAAGFAGLVLLGYLISRTFGLPGFTDDKGEWTEPLGLLSMVVESLLLTLGATVGLAARAATWASRRSSAGSGSRTRSPAAAA